MDGKSMITRFQACWRRKAGPDPEYHRQLTDMSDESILRYTDLAAVIQMARARGWPVRRIVREMSAGLVYLDALRLARKAAPLLDISVAEFMRLRRNQ